MRGEFMVIKHRHLFPGNNTSMGFFSYYAHVLPQREANHIFCLKGGPGVGKSTFMQRIADRMADEGYSIEYLHCSSDPESLDGIVIPALRVALIDGTAPHIIDPINPGAVDEIVNLGEHWDLAGIKQHKSQIIAVGEQVGQLFRRAYRYLAAAKCLMDDALALYMTESIPAGVYAEADRIVKAHIPGFISGTKPGKVRKMFASAFTPLGVVSHVDTLIRGDYTVYTVESRWGAGVTQLLAHISEKAMAYGLDVEQYYCPMDPEKRIDHLIIPAIGLAIVSSNRYINVSVTAQTVIDLAQYADQAPAAEFDEREFDVMLREALFTLNRAKVTHDEIEKYYIPYMDFQAVDRKREQIIKAILALIP